MSESVLHPLLENSFMSTLANNTRIQLTIPATIKPIDIMWQCHRIVDKSKAYPKKNIFIKVPITAL